MLGSSVLLCNNTVVWTDLKCVHHMIENSHWAGPILFLCFKPLLLFFFFFNLSFCSLTCFYFEWRLENQRASNEVVTMSGLFSEMFYFKVLKKVKYFAFYFSIFSWFNVPSPPHYLFCMETSVYIYCIERENVRMLIKDCHHYEVFFSFFGLCFCVNWTIFC